jgi:hypothetical protein
VIVNEKNFWCKQLNRLSWPEGEDQISRLQAKGEAGGGKALLQHAGHG